MMDDLIKELECLKYDLDELIWYGSITKEQKSAYMHSREMLCRTIERWRKRRTEQNSGNSIDLGELSPEMLKIQCGFGEKE